MKSNSASRYHCGSLLGVLGMYEHSDPFSDSQGVVTIFFPQDTENEFPEYTLVHELTHRELVHGSLTGNLQTILSANKKVSSCPSERRKALQDMLMHSVGKSRQVHEAVATYAGLIHQAAMNEESVKIIFSRLPPFYRSALSILETVLPRHSNLSTAKSHQYRNIILAIGKFCLNTRSIFKLMDVTDISVETLRDIIVKDSSDEIFLQLMEAMGRDPFIMDSLLDIGRQTAIDSGCESFDDFVAKSGHLGRSSLVDFLNQLDQRLMNQLSTIFSSTGNVSPTFEERGELMNRFIGRWNSSFIHKYGHQLTTFSKIEVERDPKPRIRTIPATPEVASGNRTFSSTPAPIINLSALADGLSDVKVLGLWMQVRMFINPGDEQLSLGPTAPPLEPRQTVLVLAPWQPDTVRTDRDQERMIASMRQAHPICQMHTSVYLQNSELPSVIEQFEGVPILWHIDWIMYHYAKSAGVDVEDFAGYKFIHMDNADDVTFFKFLVTKGHDGNVEGCVQWFGQQTLLVATFYRVDEPTFYSIPISHHKYEEFVETLHSVGGHLLKSDELRAKPFDYAHSIALMYQYGI